MRIDKKGEADCETRCYQKRPLLFLKTKEREREKGEKRGKSQNTFVFMSRATMVVPFSFSLNK